MAKTLSCCGAKYYDSIIPYILENKEALDEYESGNIKGPNCHIEIGQEYLYIYHNNEQPDLRTHPLNLGLHNYHTSNKYCDYCPKYIETFIYQKSGLVTCSQCKNLLCRNCIYFEGSIETLIEQAFFYSNGKPLRIHDYIYQLLCRECFKTYYFKPNSTIKVYMFGKCSNNHTTYIDPQYYSVKNTDAETRNKFFDNLLNGKHRYCKYKGCNNYT